MTSEPAEQAGESLVDEVADWLMEQALAGSDVNALIEGCSIRLRAAGVPLMRTFVGFRTLHPLFAAMFQSWHREKGMGSVGLTHGTFETSKTWRANPHMHMIENKLKTLRRRLTGEDALLDFPVLDEFVEDGATDYLAFVVPFGAGDDTGVIGSWTTDRPGGFTDGHIRILHRIEKRLAVACKVTINDQIAKNVLTAYLGAEAGRQVLDGHIQRGDYQSIHAVIWYSDMRDSTPLADSLSPEAFLETVNAYFECTAGAVLNHGGEVLRFIGDAVLAIFPIRDGVATAEEACTRALDAAREAEAWTAEINGKRAKKGQPTIGYGLGLHVGDVLYGNIGVPERLEFSVIGRAANEVARIEGLSKSLGRSILVSAAFAGNLSQQWESLGRHALRGVSEAIEVFAPAGWNGAAEA